MDIVFSILSLAGGLGFFLYGMSLMGSGLKKTAGGRLESILEKLSSTPLRGMLLGTFVTAVIQSSSATTVMVVGFVNSGMMKLSQAIGVVMGANIGTTATGWLLAMAGIDSDNFFIKLLKPTSFAPLIVLVGAAMVMFCKHAKKRYIGSILLGFGTLMVGMTMMSDAVSPFAESETFANILTLFKNPILGLLVGMVLTAIIQSNSASVGILQALALTGTVTYGMSIPLILGMDIGACVPVLISGIGATKNGKRTSLIYLYFNLIASILFMTVFYTLNAFLNFSFLADIASPIGIATFNTVFKIGAAIILIPFVGKLEKLTYLTVKDSKRESGGSEISELLDDRFLTSPGFALEQCRAVVSNMADLGKFNIESVIGLLADYKSDIVEKIIANEDIVDESEDKLGTYLLKLSSHNLTEAESKEVSKLLHSIGDFERISDHSLNLLNAAKEIHEKKIVFSEEASMELRTVESAITEILSITVTAFKNDDSKLAGQVEPLEQIIDVLCDELKNRHIGRLRHGICTIEQGFVFNDMVANYERISDHCSNIAVSVIRLGDELYDTHDYLKKLKSGEEDAFNLAYEGYREKYFDILAPASKDTQTNN